MEIEARDKLTDANTITINEGGVLKIIDLHTGEVLAANNLSIREEKSTYLYTVPIASVICDYIREGLPFTKISEKPNMPPYNVIMRWRHIHPDFAEAIKRAKLDRAELYHDKALSFAESVQTEEEVKVAKLKIDTYKWAAEKNAPEEYGKSSKNESVGGVTFVINTGVPAAEPITIEVEHDNLGETVINEDIEGTVHTFAAERPNDEEVPSPEGD